VPGEEGTETFFIRARIIIPYKGGGKGKRKHNLNLINGKKGKKKGGWIMGKKKGEGCPPVFLRGETIIMTEGGGGKKKFTYEKLISQLTVNDLYNGEGKRTNNTGRRRKEGNRVLGNKKKGDPNKKI